MEEVGISLREVRAFFDEFCLAFPAFDGKLIANRFAVPYLALNADGGLRVFGTSHDIADYFQAYLDRYHEQGCRQCSYEDLDTVRLGGASLVVSLTWRLSSAADNLIASWRESYNLLKENSRLLIYVSTDHVD